MFIARLTTTHFRFEALAEGREEAVAALEAGWIKHRDQYGGPRRVRPFSDFLEDVEVSEIAVGGCLRDGETL